MNQNLTEVVIIADRSGSMKGLESESVGGLNNFCTEQKKLSGQAVFTLVAFDDQYEVVFDRVPMENVPPITLQMIAPRGMTALLDAIGRTITYIGQKLSDTPEADRPAKVIFAILTDGQENNSKEFLPSPQQIASGVPKTKTIFDMIVHQTSVYNWQFVFLAANQDAISAAAGLGVSAANAVNYSATGVGVAAAYATVNNAVSSFRTRGVVDTGVKNNSAV